MSTATQLAGSDEVLKQIQDFPFVETDGEPLDSTWHRDCMMLLIASILYWWRRPRGLLRQRELVHLLQPAAGDEPRLPRSGFLRRQRRGAPAAGAALLGDLVREQPIARRHRRAGFAVHEREDRTTKFRIYEQTFRTRNYFIYDPIRGRLDGWELDSNRQYQPLTPNEHGWLWCIELRLWLGTWEGEYNRTHATWLRFYDQKGSVVATFEEAALRKAEDEKRRAEDEKRRADAAEAEVTRLRALLGQAGQGNGKTVPPA